jgi:microcystin-dependent protein
MAADTFTSNIGIIQQATGNNNNNWGVLLDAGLQVVDDAIAGQYVSSSTGGTVDLSGAPPPAGPSQARFAILTFNGALTANLTVILPNLTKIWLIQNVTGGAFSLLVKTPSGTATQIPQGTAKWAYCNGANVVRQDVNEVGTAVDFFGTAVPAGTLPCNGSAISRASYPDLFAKIGTTWGAGDGVTMFNLPNLQDTGRFRRSSTVSLAVGTYQGNQNLAHVHTGQATGTTDATNIDHTHNVAGNTGTESATHTHSTPQIFSQGQAASNAGANFTAINNNGAVTVTGTESQSHTHAMNFVSGAMNQSNPHGHAFTSTVFTTAATGGSEARPEAAVVLTCIRY